MECNWRGLILAILWLAGPGMTAALSAKTLEMEQEDGAVGSATPTAVDQEMDQEPSADSGQSRVRMSDNIGFYYFVSSGYVTDDPSKIPTLGSVLGSFPEQIMYSTPQKVYVELSNAIVKPGDFLVVYRTKNDIEEDHVGFLGRQVENLAILQVLEVQKTRCLTVTKECFLPYRNGDLVKSYNDEIVRWKQAQRRKLLPSQAIHCFIAAGKPGQKNYSENDSIILTAGQKEGVVEGQVFKVRKKTSTGLLEEDVHAPLGEVQVFYAGPHYSMAQVLHVSESIQKGYEAWYQP